MGIIDLISKSAVIPSRAGEGQNSSTALPLRIWCIRDEIINHRVHLNDIDICPERIVRGIANAELRACCVTELEKGFIAPLGLRRNQIDRDIHHLTWRDAHWQLA